MFRAAGLASGNAGPGNRIVMKPITIATDLGTQVIVSSGLSPSDQVVNNPPDSLCYGDQVRVESHGSSAFLLGAVWCCSACDLAPDYKVPETPQPRASRRTASGPRPRHKTRCRAAPGGKFMATQP